MSSIDHVRRRAGVGVRLAATMAAVALVSGILTGGLLYLRDRADIEKSLVEKTLALALTTAAAIDGDAHARALSTGISASSSQEFHAIRDWLRRVKNANNLKTEIYTVVLNAEGAAVFGVMTNENPFPFAPYPTKSRHDLVQLVFRTGRPAMSGLYMDEYGAWLSAFAPLRNSAGKVVAVIEIDNEIDDLVARLDRRMLIVLLLTAAGSVVAAGLGYLLSRRFSQPLRELALAADAVASGDYSTIPVIRRQDEFGRVSRSWRLMVSALLERDSRVEHLTLGLVAALERASGEYDPETGAHIRRVGAYAGYLARRYGLSEGVSRRIERYAPLHDVGKVGISASILTKHGQLSNSERRAMEQHVRIGGEILEASNGDPIAVSIARYHHERWDGTGYIEGLSGEAIPIEARIVAIADVYDALTTIRPYKPAFTHEKTVAMMSAASGAHFDPSLLACFFANEEALHEIRIRFSDEPIPARELSVGA